MTVTSSIPIRINSGHSNSNPGFLLRFRRGFTQVAKMRKQKPTPPTTRNWLAKRLRKHFRTKVISAVIICTALVTSLYAINRSRSKTTPANSVDAAMTCDTGMVPAPNGPPAHNSGSTSTAEFAGEIIAAPAGKRLPTAMFGRGSPITGRITYPRLAATKQAACNPGITRCLRSGRAGRGEPGAQGWFVPLYG
jgi:hypothetical protein